MTPFMIIFAGLITIAHAAEPRREAKSAKAVFAGGCFWSVEKFFDQVDGVVATVSGFSGGKTKNPTYEQVVSGKTGHAESVQVTYDPKKVRYEKLLDVFWRNIDPFTPGGQFCDFGSQYRTVIFYNDETEKRAAETSKNVLQGIFKRTVATEVVPATPFYPAEQYHQDFHLKNPDRYEQYRIGCGRDFQLEQIWGAQRSRKGARLSREERNYAAQSKVANRK
jgi:peptide-methionine (S)-S-oxide reductase